MADQGGLDNVAFDNDKEAGSKGAAPVTPVVSSDNVHLSVKPTTKMKEDRAGCGPCKPRCLQCLNHMPVFVIILFLANFIEGFAVNGIAGAGISTIERQFKLSSSRSSWISSSQDIGALVVILFTSFFGARYSKPMIMSGGLILMAIGSIVFIIPHILDEYDYGSAGGPSGPTDLCTTDAGNNTGPACAEGETKYLGILMLAQILHGAGYTPIIILGPVFLDSNTDHGTAAALVGATYAGAAIGVASGFFAGGEILQKYFVEFDRIDQSSLDFGPMDMQWVGAWWLGFTISAPVFFILAILMSCFPANMPGSEKYAKEGRMGPSETCCGNVVSFGKSLLKLATNPVFIFTTLAGCLGLMVLFGISSFTFKYIVEQFYQPFDLAGYILGGLILAGSVGMFAGGVIVKLLKLELKGMTRMNVMFAVTAAVFGVGFIVRCPEVNLAGLHIPYANESSIQYAAPCHSQCDCSELPFNPVCGEDNVVYYTPCHAGCSMSGATPMDPYESCSCVAENLGIANVTTVTAMWGRCPIECDEMELFGPLIFIGLFFVLLTTTPVSMVTMGCVDEDNRSLALGVQWILLRLLGSIPGPPLVGFVIDKACLVWTGGVCGSSGSCSLYSHENLSEGAMAWWISVGGAAAVLFTAAAIFATRQGKSWNK